MSHQSLLKVISALLLLPPLAGGFGGWNFLAPAAPSFAATYPSSSSCQQGGDFRLSHNRVSNLLLRMSHTTSSSNNNDREEDSSPENSLPQHESPSSPRRRSNENNASASSSTPSASSSSSSTSSSSSSSSSLSSKLHLMTKNLTAVVERKIRLAQAQAEIDLILSGPDAPLDLEHEMSKVIFVAPPPTTTLQHQEGEEENVIVEHEDEEEQQREAKESQLELDLYQAIKQQEYAKAALVKQELHQLHLDDCGAVLHANSQFYRSFSEKNIQDMEALWWKDATATCIHPSCPPLVGYKQVCESYKSMFETCGVGGVSFQRTWMEPHNIRVSVKGASMAVVSCDEHVFIRRFVRGQKRQTELINQLTATNIFRKLGGRWYMIHHHASWHPESEVAKLALLSRRPSSFASSASSLSASSSVPGFSLLNNNNFNKNSPRFITSVNNKGLRSSPSSPSPSLSSKLGMAGILGMSNYGPLLGSLGKKQQGQRQQQPPFPQPPQPRPVKRIVMGSLNDILNGQLGDILGAAGGASSKSGAGDGNEGEAIISFSRIDDDEDDDDDDEDDEEEDEDDEDDILDDLEEEEDEDDDEEEGDEEEDEESGPKTVTILTEWSKSSSSADNENDVIIKNSKNNKRSSNNNKSKQVNQVSGAPKDALRQNCISALRRLCDQGSISQKQKRLLLTDIISCSAKGEFSMVEVAYELLCGEALTEGEADVAEEEFADQCRVFALSLMAPSSSLE